MTETQPKKNRLVVDYQSMLNPPSAPLPIPNPSKRSAIPVLLLLLIISVATTTLYYLNSKKNQQPTPETSAMQEDLITLEEIKDPAPLPEERAAEMRNNEQYPAIYARYLNQWTPPISNPPDTITTMDGNVYVGEITDYNADRLTLKTSKGVSSFKMSDLRYYTRIKYSADEYASYMAMKMIELVVSREKKQ